MGLIAYTNTGKTNLHLDGKTILPGETREVDETQVPGFGVPMDSDDTEKETAAPEDVFLAGLLRGNVKEIQEALPELTSEQLERLEQLEGDAEHPRKGVLDSINKLQLERAQGGL